MEEKEHNNFDYYRRFLWLALITILLFSGIVRIGFNGPSGFANSNKPETFSRSWHEVLERTNEYLLIRAWSEFENHTDFEYRYSITVEFKPHFGQEKTLSSREFNVRKHSAITKSADFRIEGDFTRSGYSLSTDGTALRID